MKIDRIVPFRLEYNSWNGFILEFMFFEIGKFERGLFGVSINSVGIQLELFYLNIDIK